MRYHFSFDEILSEHPYDRPLIVDGVRCHGGFVDGRYVSPRTLVRSDAIAARLRARCLIILRFCFSADAILATVGLLGGCG